MIALASDFDGTLYFGHDEVHFKEQDIQAIAQFQKQGNQFGICTGRDLPSTLYPLTDRICCDFFIVVSGAAIYDKDHRLIYEKAMKRSTIQALYDSFYGQANMYIRTGFDVYEMQKSSHLSFLSKYVPSVSDLPNVPFQGVSFGCFSKEDAQRITDLTNAYFGDEIIAYRNVRFVDIVAKGCSKGNALQIYKDKMQIDVMAGIGDFYNDIPLLEKADIAFTFTWSPDPVKAYADHVVEDMAQAIDRLK